MLSHTHRDPQSQQEGIVELQSMHRLNPRTYNPTN